MSSRNEHDAMAAFTGALIALAQSTTDRHPKTPLEIACEVVGGALGAIGGSRVPDAVEPPTSSWHRSTMHSLAAAIGVGAVGAGPLMRFTNGLATSTDATPPAKRCLQAFVRGFAAGLPTGYISHVALDALTPRGIPLLIRGC